MMQAGLDSELGVCSDCGKGFLCAISYLQKIVANLVSKLLDDQVGVRLELGSLVSIKRDVWEEPTNVGKESH